MFIGKDSIDLCVKPYVITDEKTGEVKTGNTYLVRFVDDEGKTLDLKLKSASESGKSLLAYYMKG